MQETALIVELPSQSFSIFCYKTFDGLHLDLRTILQIMKWQAMNSESKELCLDIGYRSKK